MVNNLKSKIDYSRPYLPLHTTHYTLHTFPPPYHNLFLYLHTTLVITLVVPPQHHTSVQVPA